MAFLKNYISGLWLGFYVERRGSSFVEKNYNVYVISHVHAVGATYKYMPTGFRTKSCI